MSDDNTVRQRCTAIVRAEVRRHWEQSGRDCGRQEPPPPSLEVVFDSDAGVLHVEIPTFADPGDERPESRGTQPELQYSQGVRCSFSWDGTEEALVSALESIAEGYWGDYCDPSYKYWVPPSA